MVSAREVERLAAVTVAVAFACTSVPLGFPVPSSVSIRTQSDTLGETAFESDNFVVLADTPLPNTGKDIRVFAETSQIFCAEVACAVVGHCSAKTTFQAERVSQAA